MDGTLLDTQKIFVPAWEYAGRIQGIEGAGNHVYNLCGMNDEGCRRYIRENMPTVDVDRFRADMREYIRENGVVKFRDGAEELLHFLKENGIKIGLASGSSREVVERNLGGLGITDMFDAIVPGDEVQNGKPAPDIFLLAAKRMGAEVSFVPCDEKGRLRIFAPWCYVLRCRSDYFSGAISYSSS